MQHSFAKIFDNLFSLTYPHDQISVGFFWSDSFDIQFTKAKPAKLNQKFWKHTFSNEIYFHPTQPRWKPSNSNAVYPKQTKFAITQDEDWVLWLDADVCYYPKDIIQQLVETGKEIVVPNCVFGGRSFDLNTFKFKVGAELQDWTLCDRWHFTTA